MSGYHAAAPYGERRSGPGIMLGILALFLGIAVAILAIVAVVLVKTADDARDEAKIAAGATDHSTHSTASSGEVSLPLQSFAGAVPENAEALAEAHAAYDATLPPLPRAIS